MIHCSCHISLIQGIHLSVRTVHVGDENLLYVRLSEFGLDAGLYATVLAHCPFRAINN
jgi:hypothetical protein